MAPALRGDALTLSVAPCVIIGAYKQYKNGLRPSPDAKKPWLLKDVVTIRFHVFACLVSEASDGSCTYTTSRPTSA